MRKMLEPVDRRSSIDPALSNHDYLLANISYDLERENDHPSRPLLARYETKARHGPGQKVRDMSRPGRVVTSLRWTVTRARNNNPSFLRS